MSHSPEEIIVDLTIAGVQLIEIPSPFAKSSVKDSNDFSVQIDNEGMNAGDLVLQMQTANTVNDAHLLDKGASIIPTQADDTNIFEVVKARTKRWVLKVDPGTVNVGELKVNVFQTR